MDLARAVRAFFFGSAVGAHADIPSATAPRHGRLFSGTTPLESV